MPDKIATFPLRGAASNDLGLALGRSFAEFVAWYGQALLVAGFAQDALAGGVKVVLADRLYQAMEIGEAEGLILSTPAKTKSNREIAKILADHQLGMADQGVKIAAIVMLHNAYERFLWRLVRFGLVGNRERALKSIGRKSVTVETLVKEDINTSLDALLEKSWEELERDTMATKWDRLAALVDFPARLNSPPWHFDRKMVEQFDDVRHNAVHHDALAVKTFDLVSFANQLWRAQWIWLAQVAILLKIKIPAESLFAGK
jgi:hypothetical protein